MSGEAGRGQPAYTPSPAPLLVPNPLWASCSFSHCIGGPCDLALHIPCFVSISPHPLLPPTGPSGLASVPTSANSLHLPADAGLPETRPLKPFVFPTPHTSGPVVAEGPSLLLVASKLSLSCGKLPAPQNRTHGPPTSTTPQAIILSNLSTLKAMPCLCPWPPGCCPLLPQPGCCLPRNCAHRLLPPCARGPYSFCPRPHSCKHIRSTKE